MALQVFQALTRGRGLLAIDTVEVRYNKSQFQALTRGRGLLSTLLLVLDDQVSLFQALTRGRGLGARECKGWYRGKCVLVSSPLAGTRPVSQVPTPGPKPPIWKFQALKRVPSLVSSTEEEDELRVLIVSSPLAGTRPVSLSYMEILARQQSAFQAL